MDPNQLSRELRLGTGQDLANRRRMIGLSILGAAIGGLVGAYQTGMVRTLPDPPVGPFDSARVDASAYGYRRLDTPDGFLMMITYAVTAALAAAGGRRRAEAQPFLPLMTAGKALYDVVTCARLAREEWAENKALCAYCQLATVASVVTFALSLPEAARAARALGQRSR
ncbi:vitamin K epoxide reductase family protein [Chthonobacter rhizosphaerae]|uniref:vitamin K epoxide reductase family protein n=1 Tax=Chthonobacter rhizosphaerae TaxID=2735553 RepID=UPI0015EF0BFB|nr:vitamin K epoxide reductase family protein [Chthonobacter rhizosphaerae]